MVPRSHAEPDGTAGMVKFGSCEIVLKRMLARRAACNLVSSQFNDGDHNGDIIWFIGAQLRDLEQIVDEQASGER